MTREEHCEDWYDVPSNEMILEQARQAVKDLRKRFKEDLEQEPTEFEEIDFVQEHKKIPVTFDLTPCDEYGNYRYPSDIELPEPNTATSMPCGDAISRQAVIDAIEDDNRNGHYSCFASNNDAQCFKDVIHELPSVNPQEPKTGHWIKTPLGFKCSKCLIVHSHTSIFCPSCGAKMIEPQESEDKE